MKVFLFLFYKFVYVLLEILLNYISKKFCKFLNSLFLGSMNNYFRWLFKFVGIVFIVYLLFRDLFC